MSEAAPTVLFITQRAPPHRGAGARRMAHLIQRAAEGGRVIVIRRSADGAAAIAGASEVHSIATGDIRSVTGVGATLSPAAGKKRWLTAARRLRQATPFVYLTDDGGPVYRRRAYQLACRLIEAHGIQTLFSSFRPWSDHLVARRLKRKYPHLHWVADFRDLPVDPVRRDVWWPALQRWWGKRVIRLADEVWCVSRGQQVQLVGWHPTIKIRYNALLTLPPERTAPITERFTIVYTGSLYPGLQSVAPLVRALRALLNDGVIPPSQLSLVYRGKDADVFRSWVAGLPAECLDIQPSIAPAAAQRLQRAAQLLLLLNWSAPGYYGVLTAKLWDYLATGRPILALVNGPGDEELSEIILGADAGAVFGVEAEVGEWLGARFGEWKQNHCLPWSPRIDKLSPFAAKER